MSKKIVSLLVLVSFLLIGGIAFAQEKEVVKPGVISPAFKAKIEPTKANIKALEGVLGRMEKTKKITKSDVDEIDRNMDKYATDLIAAFDMALKSAREFAESKGAKGNIEDLKAFEARVKKDEETFKGLESKGKRIHDLARDGVIKYDKVLIEGMTLEERREHFTPKGRERLEKELPDIFKELPPTRSEIQPANPISVGSIPGQIGSLFVSEAEAFVSEAEAAAGAACIAPCVAAKWPVCISCLVGTVAAGFECGKSFRSCWDCAGKPWWMARWFYRTFWCIPKLVICVG